MTASVPPMGPEAFAVDPERELEAYAASVRIVASGTFLRRIEASVAQERTVASVGPLRRMAARLTGRDLRPTPRATGPRVAGALLRPSLVALLLLVLALGAAVGGAGAVVVSLITPAPEAPTEPVQRAVPDPAVPTRALQRSTIAPDPDGRGSELVSPAPVVRVSIAPQRRPDPPRRGAHGRAHADATAHRTARGTAHPRNPVHRLRPASFREVTGTAGRIGCDRSDDEATLPTGSLVLPRIHARRCSF